MLGGPKGVSEALGATMQKIYSILKGVTSNSE